MYTIQNDFTLKLVSNLFFKTLAMLKQLNETNNIVMEYECPEFAWEVDEDEFGEMTISFGIFKGFNFIGTWNNKIEPKEMEITINIKNYDLTQNNNLDRFVEMEKLVFDAIEKRINEKNDETIIPGKI